MRRTLLFPSLMALLLSFGPPVAAAGAEGDAVRLTLDGPGTPFERVELEAKVRGPSVVVRLTQSYGEPYASRDAVGLSTPAELAALVALLKTDGLGDLPRVPPAVPSVSAAIRYRIEVTTDGRQQSLTVTSPELLTDRRYLTLVRHIRSWVVGVTGAPPFVDGRLTAEDSGFLHLETRPSGRVFLNEVLLADSTPVEALRVPLGAHVLRVVAPDGKLERSLGITIEKGKTTSLQMNLE